MAIFKVHTADIFKLKRADLEDDQRPATSTQVG